MIDGDVVSDIMKLFEFFFSTSFDFSEGRKMTMNRHGLRVKDACRCGRTFAGCRIYTLHTLLSFGHAGLMSTSAPLLEKRMRDHH